MSQTFSIEKQLQKDIDDFYSGKVQLASVVDPTKSARYLSKGGGSYAFNQYEMIGKIDLYYNSQFETGSLDEGGNRKIFMNVGKFRTEVAAKQIDIDTKDFRFIPDDYADPYTSIFMQKDFKEWVKESDFAELLNQCVDNLPKYGSIVIKEVNKGVAWVPLQNLINEQTAESLQTASYVIEMHPDMQPWELNEHPEWDLSGLDLKYGQCVTVYERYGYVPRSWIEAANGRGKVVAGDSEFVDALVIVGRKKDAPKGDESGYCLLFAEAIKKRPYRECHWNKQHGRWLGLGVMEDLLENQTAKNIVVNLTRKSMEWSSKRVFQTAAVNEGARSLLTEVEDGAVLETGVSPINELVITPRTGNDFTEFLNEFEKNSDQKAFTYEVATGESLPSGTPFRLGVVLSNAVNTYFSFKREKLGLFLKKVIEDFQIPKFLRDMGNRERTLAMFSGEPGFNVLRDAATKLFQSETARFNIFNGNPVDGSLLSEVADPYKGNEKLFFKLTATQYKDAKYKFELTVTGEEVDLPNKIASLQTIATVLAQRGDPRAELVLNKIASLVGEDMSQFGSPQKIAPPQGMPQPGGQPASPLPAAANANSPAVPVGA